MIEAETQALDNNQYLHQIVEIPNRLFINKAEHRVKNLK